MKNVLDIKHLILLFILFLSAENINCKDNQFSKTNPPKIQSFSNPQYIRYWGNTNNSNCTFSKFDKNGDFIVLGFSQGTITLTTDRLQQGNAGGIDLFLSKFNSKGDLIWSTMFGGAGTEYPHDLEIDEDNNIWICGETRSANFPTTANRFSGFNGFADGFISKISPDCKLIFSSCFGGADYDAILQIALDSKGTCYGVGRTSSNNFKVTLNAKEPANLSGNYCGIIVNVAQDFTFYSSYMGLLLGQPHFFLEGITIDSKDNIIVGGFTNFAGYSTLNSKLNTAYAGGAWDIFIRKYDANFNLIWNAIYGGSGIDRISNLGTDNKDNIYALCYTNSPDLTNKNSLNMPYSGNMDGYVMSITADSEMIWGTYLGGSGVEGKTSNNNDTDRFPSDLFVNNNFIGVNFRSSSPDITSVGSSFQSKNIDLSGNTYDSYSIIFNTNGSPFYSSFFGGSKNDYSNSICFTDSSLLICGYAESSDLSITTTHYIQQNTGFIALFGIAPAPPDTTLPFISNFETDPCNTYKKYIISDSCEVNPGMKTGYLVNSQVNCSINVNLVNKRLEITVNLIDKSKPGNFNISVYNLNGKELIISDSLLSASYGTIFSFVPKDTLNFGGLEYSRMKCLNLTIKNLTNNTQVIDNLPLVFNLEFSIPPNQLPITIPAKDSAKVEVCFYPLTLKYGRHYDTLYFDNPCNSAKIALIGELLHSEYSSGTYCDVDILAKTDTSGRSTVGIIPELMINKKSNEIIDISLNFTPKSGKIILMDILGNQVLSASVESSKLTVRTADLPAGPYYILYTSPALVLTGKVILIK
jgi:hypothetical protein